MLQAALESIAPVQQYTLEQLLKTMLQLTYTTIDNTNILTKKTSSHQAIYKKSAQRFVVGYNNKNLKVLSTL